MKSNFSRQIQEDLKKNCRLCEGKAFNINEKIIRETYMHMLNARSQKYCSRVK